MFFIFEMANNHQGDIEHGKEIIRSFAALAKKYDVSAGVKFQFRQLDTFIHPKFQNSDLKYVKRFNNTKLNERDFLEMSQFAKEAGLKTVATPFDSESIPLLERCDIDIIKVASCSVNDWSLLRDISEKNKKIIISTAGADFDTLHDVYRLFKSKERDFAFLHCVAEYPTTPDRADLKRIKRLQETFSDIEIGFSTHESPEQESLIPFAMSLGCTIFEKHVAVQNSNYPINKYSCTPEQIERVFQKIKFLKSAFEGESKEQNLALSNLRRGVYAKRNISRGEVINEDDIFLAMPRQAGQLDASMIDSIVGAYASSNIEASHAINQTYVSHKEDRTLDNIKSNILKQLERAGVKVTSKDRCDISCHYGLKNFEKVGAFVVNKVNREYCKKLIVMLPGQRHPAHYHVRKEECFELLSGDCTLVLNQKSIRMKKGEVKLIPRKTKHSFFSKNGCVIEEISTTHVRGDSIYEDPVIFKLPVSDRKIKIQGLNS